MDVVGWIRDDRGARPAWLRYAAAVVVVLLASFLSVALHPWLLSAPLAPYFAAVAFVAWFGGFGPAIATLVLSLPPITLFALEPLGTWSVTRDEEAALVIFVLVSALLALLTASRDRLVKR